jgi:mRNA-degrading endonuclease RelE of RelBE toxin-antitoxin system
VVRILPELKRSHHLVAQIASAYRSLRINDPAGTKCVSLAIAMLADEPYPETSSVLGGTAFRRLRLDLYRVLYELTRNTVYILHVGRVYHPEQALRAEE